MALLNPPGALPGLTQAILTFLAAKADRSIRIQELRDLMAPATLGGMPDGEAGSRCLSETLTVGRSIALWDGTDPIVLNKSALEFCRPDASDVDFRRGIRRKLLDPTQVGDPWTFKKDRDADSTGSRDFARAATWWLLQSSFDAPLAWESQNDPRYSVQERQKSISDRVPRPIWNDTRWQSFERWAPYVGLARPVTVAGKECLMPDASRAVGDELMPLLSTEPRPITTVLEKLTQVLPIVQGGAFRRTLAEHLAAAKETAQRDADMMDSVVAQACLALEDAGLVTLEHLSDAEGVVMIADERDTLRRCSHIRRGLADGSAPS